MGMEGTQPEMTERTKDLEQLHSTLPPSCSPLLFFLLTSFLFPLSTPKYLIIVSIHAGLAITLPTDFYTDNIGPAYHHGLPYVVGSPPHPSPSVPTRFAPNCEGTRAGVSPAAYVDLQKCTSQTLPCRSSSQLTEDDLSRLHAEVSETAVIKSLRQDDDCPSTWRSQSVPMHHS